VDELDTSRSSWIEAVTYDDEEGLMTVTIRGEDFTYSIGPETWESFKQAPSLGAFYNYFIKEKP